MTEPALKFGPEWLRALSQGSSVLSSAPTSPPPSPGPPKYKLAEHRYGREEMLALFSKDVKMPPDLRQFYDVIKESCSLPVSLIPISEEEQRIWARSINSDSVLRLLGRGGPTGLVGPPPRGGGRGVSVDRGRGRGRATYYQRGDEDGEIPAPGFSRQRTFERSSSLTDRAVGWEERERRYDKNFNARDNDDPTRKDGSRPSLVWRTGNPSRDREGEDDGGWRINNSRNDKWVRSGSGWRSDRDERERHHDGDPGSDWHDNYVLPEWSVEDSKDAESVGTFDSSGAFMETKAGKIGVKLKNDEEPSANYSQAKEDACRQGSTESVSDPSTLSTPEDLEQFSPEPQLHSPTPVEEQRDKFSEAKAKPKEVASNVAPVVTAAAVPVAAVKQETPRKCASPQHLVSAPFVERKEEVNFEHLEKAAESLVDTWTAEEDEKVQANHVRSAPVLPWYYCDPQGIVQGPFTDLEMSEWFSTGYFNMTLLVRRGMEDRFCPLGDLVKQYGCVPFAAGAPVPSTKPLPQPALPPKSAPPPPSLLNGILGPSHAPHSHAELPSEREQQLHMIQQQILQQQFLQQQILQQQQQQQQLLIRQQLQQVLGSAKPIESFSGLNAPQQQQHPHFYMQRIMQQQQQQAPRPLVHSQIRLPTENGELPNPLQQFVARMATQAPPPIPKEDAPLWHMPTASSSAPPVSHPDIVGRWNGVPERPSSIWDLETSARDVAGTGPPRPSAETFEREQKMLEEQLKRQQQQLLLKEEEALRKQQEDERLKRQKEENERLQRELQHRRREEEEAAAEQQRQQQLQLEEAARRRREVEEKKREAEERRRKEEEFRRKEEERIQQEEREQEERRKQEERRQQAEERRKQEEARRMEEERLRLEEVKRLQEQQMEELRRAEEERRRLEEEQNLKKQNREMQRQLEIQQQEALKKLQEKQKDAAKAQAPAWGGRVSVPNDASLTLSEIQKLQEEKELQEKKLQQQQLQKQIEREKQANAAAKAAAASLTWASRSAANPGPVKSLLEIQQEEAVKLAQQKQQQQREQQVLQQVQAQRQQQQQFQKQQKQQQQNNVSLVTGSVWSSLTSTQWSADGSGDDWGDSAAFWDDAVATVVPSNKRQPQHGGTKAATASSNSKAPSTNGQSGKARAGRTRKEEETVLKLFENRTQKLDDFTQWCTQTLAAMQSTIDVPTFVAFLKDVDSPYEVHDYVRSYLGESKEANNFAKQFVEKRSKYRNKARKTEEDMWGPAPAITPCPSKPREGESDGPKSASSKKKKKSKMQKVDNAFLGFTVHAALDRVNVGMIDRVEDV